MNKEIPPSFYKCLVTLLFSSSWLYFNNYGQQKLERVSLSGGNRQVVITSGSRMGDIALDITNQKIYWSISDKIESSNVNGTGRSTVRAILPQPHPQQGISYFSSAIYFTNYYTIRYSASNGTGGETVLLTKSTPIIYGLQVVDVSNQPLPGEWRWLISSTACVSSSVWL